MIFHGPARLELSRELEGLKALKSSNDSEKTALAARVASLEAVAWCRATGGSEGEENVAKCGECGMLMVLSSPTIWNN